jgi:hypothetical protein
MEPVPDSACSALPNSCSESPKKKRTPISAIPIDDPLTAPSSLLALFFTHNPVPGVSHKSRSDTFLTPFSVQLGKMMKSLVILKL